LDFTFVIVLIVLKAIADELKHQFGIQPNDLALDAMSKMIENTLYEIDNKHIESIKKSKYSYIT
jgi:putative membrane protein